MKNLIFMENKLLIMVRSGLKFKGKSRKFEEDIRLIFHEIADILGLNPKINVIYYYFLLYGKITQKQLCDLTHYSPSLISVLLIKMQKRGLILKNTIPTSKSYGYFLRINFFSVYYSAHFNNDQIYSELKLLDYELQGYIKKEVPGSALLSFKLREQYNFTEAIELGHLKKMILDAINSTSEFIRREIFCFEPIEFAPEIEEIERKVHILIMKSDNILPQSTKTSSSILAYFVTRRVLSQKIIKNLTGYSNGKISQTLKFLAERTNMRVILPRDNTRPNLRYYIIDFYMYTNLDYIFRFIQDFHHSELKILRIKKKLDQATWEDSFERGFCKIYTFVYKYLLPVCKHYSDIEKICCSKLKDFNEFCQENNIDLEIGEFE
ncbi:MarR family transcriptional regulator [Candidatus Lokiarchaeum ossiferum]|uniref:MarR family transcriptional regulator n=1 Tax=Candidatus Lokiarchaeum ossiferum TaxID=2951803 RepID=UPI00352EAFF7